MFIFLFVLHILQFGIIANDGESMVDLSVLLYNWLNIIWNYDNYN